MPFSDSIKIFVYLTDRNRLSFLKDSLVQWKEQWPSKPLIPVRVWEELL